MPATTILIADDHPVYRQGLRRILESDYPLVDEVGNSEDAVAQSVKHRPHIVLMDIDMPGMGGLAAIKAIREQVPETRVVVVSASDDEETIMAAIQAGASGYVLKSDALQDVLAAVRCAAEGHAYLPPSIAGRVLHGVSTLVNGRRTAEPNQLTERESEVLRLIVAGQRNRDIGRALSISERTVGNHIANIYAKLQVSDRAEAIVYAIKQGLVSI